MRDIRPVSGFPLLEIFSSEGKLLVLSDVHLGTAREWRRGGVRVKNEDELLELKRIILENHADKIILLGDVKATNFGFKKWEENELINFIHDLKIPVEIVRGNHDGGLSNILFRNAIVHDDIIITKRTASGARIGLAHGHLLPLDKISSLGLDALIIGHFHPSILIMDEVGARWHIKAWLYGEIEVQDSLLKIIIMPSVNPLIVGMPLNQSKETLEEILLVIGKEKISFENFNAMTLDLIDLGKIGDLIIH